MMGWRSHHWSGGRRLRSFACSVRPETRAQQVDLPLSPTGFHAIPQVEVYATEEADRDRAEEAGAPHCSSHGLEVHDESARGVVVAAEAARRDAVLDGTERRREKAASVQVHDEVKEASRSRTEEAREHAHAQVRVHVQVRD
jgi:hypothetical protein